MKLEQEHREQGRLKQMRAAMIAQELEQMQAMLTVVRERVAAAEAAEEQLVRAEAAAQLAAQKRLNATAATEAATQLAAQKRLTASAEADARRLEARLAEQMEDKALAAQAEMRADVERELELSEERRRRQEQAVVFEAAMQEERRRRRQAELERERREAEVRELQEETLRRRDAVQQLDTALARRLHEEEQAALERNQREMYSNGAAAILLEAEQQQLDLDSIETARRQRQEQHKSSREAHKEEQWADQRLAQKLHEEEQDGASLGVVAWQLQEDEQWARAQADADAIAASEQAEQLRLQQEVEQYEASLQLFRQEGRSTQSIEKDLEECRVLLAVSRSRMLRQRSTQVAEVAGVVVAPVSWVWEYETRGTG